MNENIEQQSSIEEEILSEQLDNDVLEEIREEGIEHKDGEWIDGMGSTDTNSIMKLQKTDNELKKDVFWYTDKNGNKPKLEINHSELHQWLGKNGFSLLRDGKDNTSSADIISNRNGIIDRENENTMRQFIYEYFKDKESMYWDDENQYGVFKEGKSGDMWCKLEVMTRLYNLSFNTKTLEYQLMVSWKKYDYNTLPTLLDDNKNVYIPFRNKIVHITDKTIRVLNYDKVKKGSIWKSQIIAHDISDRKDNSEGLFEMFCRLATSKRMLAPLKNNSDWTDMYETNDDVLKSLRTSYGYMLSNYNNPSQPIAPIYIDGDAEIGMEEGRNGKSVVMRSIQYWKKVAYQSGKAYRSVNTSGGRFQYENVELDTKFVFLNDTPSDFDMADIYDRLSDDFEVSGKFQKKFVIPQDKKPKMGVTTNYPPIQRGGSARHRMMIVPFGNYWLQVNEHHESPTDEKHLGKMLFQHDFTIGDWNEFYHFGFDCVQQYLKDGLHRCNTDDIKEKGLITKWEDGTDNGVVRWFIDIVENERIPELASLPGLKRTELFKQLCNFLKSNLTLKLHWLSNERGFHKMVWEICKARGYKYNEHKSHMGDGANNRRHLKMKNGKQVEYIVIKK